MIVYLASYPRSGNSWIRRMLRNRFRCIDSPLHGDPVKVRELFLEQEEWNLEGYFELVDYPPADGENLFARYRSLNPPGPERLLLMPGNQRRFEDEEFRRHLAGLEQRFFVKTHWPPYDRYFAGESVVQPVRHPGAALWSYYRFLRDVEKRDVSLQAVIAGIEGFGCWSRYHQAWGVAANGLGERLLRVRYESLCDDEEAFLQQLSVFTGLPIVAEDHKPFAFYQQRRPLIARCGEPDDWRRHFDVARLKQLLDLHREQMRRLGYLPDSTPVCCPGNV